MLTFKMSISYSHVKKNQFFFSIEIYFAGYSQMTER